MWTAPGLPEAVWFESRGHRPLFEHGMVLLLDVDGRDVADGFEQPPGDYQKFRVRTDLPRITPASPIARIRRATMQRATSNPSRCSCRQTLRTP